MIGVGTLINIVAIIAGGICGHIFGRFMTEVALANLLPAIVIAVIMAFLPFEV